MAAPAQCLAPSPLDKVDVGVEGIHQLTRFLDDALGVDDERSVQGGDLFDRLPTRGSSRSRSLRP